MLVDIAVMAVMARLLTPTDYGVFAAALLYLALCDLLREIGVSSTIIQLPNLSLTDQRTGFTLVLFTGTVAFLVSLLSAGLFADFMGMPQLEAVVQVMAFSLLIQVFGNISQGLMLRRMEAVKVSVWEFVTRAVTSIFIGISLALAGFGYWSLVIASVADITLRTIALVIMAKPPLKPMLDRDSARRLLHTGSGFAASRILAFISQKIDIAIVGKFLDAANLGIYSRASKLMQLPSTLYTKVADRTVFPAMAKVQDEPVRLRSAFLRGMELTAVLGLPLTVCVCLLSHEIIGVLMGERWLAVVPIFTIFSLAMYFRLISRVSSTVLRATASMRALVTAQMINTLLILVSSLAAVRYGLEAVAWAITACTFILCVLVTVPACIRTGVGAVAFLLAQRHGAVLGLLTGMVCALVSMAVRQAGLPGLVVLGANAVALGLLGCLLLVTAPRWCLGPETAQTAVKLRSMIGQRVKRRGR